MQMEHCENGKVTGIWQLGMLEVYTELKVQEM